MSVSVYLWRVGDKASATQLWGLLLYKCILQVRSVLPHVKTYFNAKPWPHTVAGMRLRLSVIRNILGKWLVNLAID